MVRGSGYGLGYKALLKDLGIDAHIRVWTDSSASIGICSRQGLGKLSYIDTHIVDPTSCTYWKNRSKKVLGSDNPADLLTKHNITPEKLKQLIRLYGCRYEDGKPEAAPKLRTGSTGKR